MVNVRSLTSLPLQGIQGHITQIKPTGEQNINNDRYCIQQHTHKDEKALSIKTKEIKLSATIR